MGSAEDELDPDRVEMQDVLGYAVPREEEPAEPELPIRWASGPAPASRPPEPPSPWSLPIDRGGAELFGDFVADELTRETERRSTLDARAVSVLTTSGTFVSLSVALGALFAKTGDFRPSVLETVLLAIALCGFVLAAAIAAVAAQLTRYHAISTAELWRWRNPGVWSRDAGEVRSFLLGLRARLIDSMRTSNDRKAIKLTKAIWVQVAAIGFLGLTVVALFVSAVA